MRVSIAMLNIADKVSDAQKETGKERDRRRDRKRDSEKDWKRLRESKRERENEGEGEGEGGGRAYQDASSHPQEGRGDQTVAYSPNSLCKFQQELRSNHPRNRQRIRLSSLGLSVKKMRRPSDEAQVARHGRLSLPLVARNVPLVYSSRGGQRERKENAQRSTHEKRRSRSPRSGRSSGTDLSRHSRDFKAFHASVMSRGSRVCQSQHARLGWYIVTDDTDWSDTRHVRICREYRKSSTRN